MIVGFDYNKTLLAFGSIYFAIILPKNKGIHMMLYDCSKNIPYKVVALHTTDKMLKDRLIAMGICPDSTITLYNTTLTKATLCVMVNSTQIALRAQEAKEIEVSPLS